MAAAELVAAIGANAKFMLSVLVVSRRAAVRRQDARRASLGPRWRPRPSHIDLSGVYPPTHAAYLARAERASASADAIALLKAWPGGSR